MFYHSSIYADFELSRIMNLFDLLASNSNIVL